MHHSSSKTIRIFSAGEVQSIHVSRVAPLVERRRRLVVLEAADDSAVDHHLERGRVEYSLKSQLEFEGGHTLDIQLKSSFF